MSFKFLFKSIASKSVKSLPISKMNGKAALTVGAVGVSVALFIKCVNIFNHYSTEKMADETANIQLKTEQNNHKIVLWVIATVVTELLF